MYSKSENVCIYVLCKFCIVEDVCILNVLRIAYALLFLKAKNKSHADISHNENYFI
eukprot:UN28292